MSRREFLTRQGGQRLLGLPPRSTSMITGDDGMDEKKNYYYYDDGGSCSPTTPITTNKRTGPGMESLCTAMASKYTTCEIHNKKKSHMTRTSRRSTRTKTKHQDEVSSSKSNNQEDDEEEQSRIIFDLIDNMRTFMMIDELLEQDDSRSIWSIPSLSSINPGSVVTDAAGSTSFHSSSLSGSTRRSGPTKKASMTSVATSSSTASSFDHDDGKSVSSMVSEQTALRHRMRVILLDGIVENMLAETVDYLEPVVQNTSACGAERDKRQRTKWGGTSHPQAEFTVCRPPRAADESGSSSVSIGEERSHHRLASRNPDDSVPLPPPPTHQGGFGGASRSTPSPPPSIRGDTIPCVPSRRSEPSATMTKKIHPRVVRRTTSYDFVPSKPRRTSSGDLDGFHQSSRRT